MSKINTKEKLHLNQFRNSWFSDFILRSLPITGKLEFQKWVKVGHQERKLIL